MSNNGLDPISIKTDQVIVAVEDQPLSAKDLALGAVATAGTTKHVVKADIAPRGKYPHARVQ